jgi:hypothetical protein
VTKRRDDGELGRARPLAHDRGRELLRDVQRARRADAGDPRVRGHADARERAYPHGDPRREVLRRVHEQPTEAGRAGGREDAVPVRGGAALDLGEAEALVGDDRVPLLHQRRLREDGKVFERERLGAGRRAEQVAVPGRALGGVPQERGECVATMLQQLCA